MEVLHGPEVDDRQWRLWHRFYRSTFERKGGMPTLSEGFFREIGTTLGEAVILIMAHRNGRPVAAALMLRNDHTLYGRHWGCESAFDSLHFETCYYQGIEYAIRHRLARFEPGAQGEHKVSRGFMPTSTWSMHWLRDRDFRDLIARHLAHERLVVEQHMQALCAALPYRRNET
jgi:predicted N-acyltransferase